MTLATALILSTSSHASPFPAPREDSHSSGIQSETVPADEDGGTANQIRAKVDDRWGDQRGAGVEDADAFDPTMQFVEMPGSHETGRAHGWMSRWLSIGGEGEVVVQVRSPPRSRFSSALLLLTALELPFALAASAVSLVKNCLGQDNHANRLQLGHSDNVTLPHRPAAFPSTLFPPFSLPFTGTLKPITELLSADDDNTSLTQSSYSEDTLGSEQEAVSLQREHFDLRYATPMQACIPAPTSRQQTPMGSIIALVERGSCDFARKVRAAQVRGAKAVIVGDGKAREAETEEEGKERENLITMFSPGAYLFRCPSSITTASGSFCYGPNSCYLATVLGQDKGPGIR